tara:strand:- start:568 stop:858 length:291 start_codon:yes stop_codon:yes gene_type:complete
MCIFDIKEIRQHILSYVYPVIVKKGMWIKMYKGLFINTPHIERVLQIYKITRLENGDITVVIKTESNESRDDNRWYCVYSYLYPSHGDIIKVIKYE